MIKPNTLAMMGCTMFQILWMIFLMTSHKPVKKPRKASHLFHRVVKIPITKVMAAAIQPTMGMLIMAALTLRQAALAIAPIVVKLPPVSKAANEVA